MTKIIVEKPVTETRDFYRLRDKTGQIVMLAVTPNETSDMAGAHSYEFSPIGENEARFTSVRALQRALAINTPWYNSSAKTPGWGQMDPSTFSIERVQEKITTQVFKYDPADLVLPRWKKGFFLTDIRPAADIAFPGDPVVLQSNHRIAIITEEPDIVPASLINREFFLGERRCRGVAETTFADAPALLIEVDV